jgi:hypothetical protein
MTEVDDSHDLIFFKALTTQGFYLNEFIRLGFVQINLIQQNLF